MFAMSLEDKIRQLPAAPGVYLMRDADGKIIYVGIRHQVEKARFPPTISRQACSDFLLQ
jgi:hypothetical protein